MRSPDLSSRAPLKVAVYAGPTGGHLFPAQAFAESFRDRHFGSRLELVTSARAKKLVARFPKGLFDGVHYLPDFGLPNRLFSFQSLKPLFLAPYLFTRSFFHLRSFRPDLCVGFGSFVSYPGMRLARLLGIPTLLHEQNQYAGKATRWLVRHADAVAESFEGTNFLAATRRLYTTGLPLRKLILHGEFHGTRQSDQIRILVMGGSQGARGLNRAVLDCWSTLRDEEKNKFAVTHITGDKEAESVAERYGELGVRSRVYPFYENMAELFRGSELAVTRAGANTLFELAFYGLPAFVVPFPHAGGHQRLNAQAFARHGALEFHDEDELLGGWLADKMRGVLENRGQLESMSVAMKNLARPKAGDQLVEISLELLKKHDDRS